MALDLERLIRPTILRMRAYQSARSLVTDAAVFLDANEAADGRFNRYPVPQPPALVQRFSELYGVPPENVLVGRGSDEAIDTLTRALCEPESDKILITPPTYGMYEVSAAIQNSPVVKVPLNFDGEAWSLDLASMTACATTESVKIVYVCSPNNPTGGAFPVQAIRELCTGVGPGTLVVVDEAYGEFASEYSAVPLLPEFSNLTVLRTLSKAWGLAGLRCGVVLADPSLISVLQKVRAPYPLPQPVIDAALELTVETGHSEMRTRVQRILDQREKLSQALAKSPLVQKVFATDANFILARFHDEAAVMRATKAEGLILRSRATESGLSGCIRITVGSESENALLLEMLEDLSRGGNA